MSVLGYWGQGIKRFSLELQTIHQFSQSRRRHYAKQLWFSFVPALSAVYPIIYSEPRWRLSCVSPDRLFCRPIAEHQSAGMRNTRGHSGALLLSLYWEINFCPPQHLCQSIFLSFNANKCTMHYATTVCHSRLCVYGGVMTWLIKNLQFWWGLFPFYMVSLHSLIFEQFLNS